MVDRPRLLTHFESLDGTVVVELPKRAYEWESSQGVRSAIEPAVGADYGVDLHGVLPAPLDVASERVRGLVVAASGAALDSDLAALRANLHAIGRGKLHATDGDGAYRWAWARLASMPDVSITYEMRRHAPFICQFTRLSDWFSATKTTVQQTILASPTTVNVTNDGAAPARAITFLLAAKGAGGFSSPSIANALTSESWASTRVAANASAQLRVDTGRMSVEYSTDAGNSWVDDYANFSTGAVQIGFLRLLPGSQSLTVTGVTNADLTVEFYAPYR